jgi:hydroxyethylthiazole kinase-like uncharacterized protein yjeF
MKIVTAAQMKQIDGECARRGTPTSVLMENAGRAVAGETRKFLGALEFHRIVCLVGAGNNGGDGLVAARQLWLRARPGRLDVVLAADPAQLRGDAAENFRMLRVCGCPVQGALTPEMREATIVVDALLGTGLNGPASGDMAGLIREINAGFPRAKIVAVDIPSGLGSDSGAIPGEAVQADYTVTFTAPKVGHVLPPACDRVGELRVCAIGSPPSLYEGDESIFLSLLEPAVFRHLLGPRPRAETPGPPWPPLRYCRASRR